MLTSDHDDDHHHDDHDYDDKEKLGFHFLALSALN